MGKFSADLVLQFNSNVIIKVIYCLITAKRGWILFISDRDVFICGVTWGETNCDAGSKEAAGLRWLIIAERSLNLIMMAWLLPFDDKKTEDGAWASNTEVQES